MMVMNMRVIVVVMHMMMYFTDSTAVTVHSINYVRVLNTELWLRTVCTARDGSWISIACPSVADLLWVRCRARLESSLILSRSTEHANRSSIEPTVVHLCTDLVPAHWILAALVVIEIWQAHVFMVSK